MDMWSIGLITLAGSYAIGALPTAVLLAKILGLPDPRSYGSGNPGATNMLRGGGKSSKKAALVTLLGDILKGMLAVALAQYWGGPAALALLGAVLGHCYSIWLNFKGGKGVATAIGVLLIYQPLFALSVLAIFIGIFAVSRMVSLGSVLAAGLAPLMLIFAPMLRLPRPEGFLFWLDVPCMILLSVVVIWRHRDNIRRICQGNESQWHRKNARDPSTPSP